MRLHVLGVPHTISSEVFSACAYTQKVVKFCKMMSERGHTVIHYGHEDSDVVCDEHVTILTREEHQETYGDHDWRTHFFKFANNDEAYKIFFKKGIEEVGKRKQKHDFLLAFWGHGVRPICDVHNDMIVVEPGIGYASGHFAKWKVFESYALLHAFWGIKKVERCNPQWYDTVIPNYFDLKDFEYTPEKKEDYFLFVGRIYEGKGIHIAQQATKEAGVKLVVAGQNDKDWNFDPHVEFVGYVDIDQRKKLMSRARGALIPSQYIEPFGGVQIENLLSGTPTITTDWGAFVENNIHGVTGYRCRTFADFVHAIKDIDDIDPWMCRKKGEEFSLEAIAPRYEKYFQDILNVYTSEGWYTL